jgi:hypothetical protein
MGASKGICAQISIGSHLNSQNNLSDNIGEFYKSYNFLIRIELIRNNIFDLEQYHA